MLINKLDNVEVNIENGHKYAVCTINKGENIIKYGEPIGHAVCDIRKGEHVHTHNMKTNLSEKIEYTYIPYEVKTNYIETDITFMGYVRENGNVGIRNDIWIVNTVGCVNKTAEKIAKITGAKCFLHPFGCSQLGDDQKTTQFVLKGLVNNPNAGGVLVLGLGCENNNIAEFKKVLGEYDENRVIFLVCQDVEDEVEEGVKLVRKLQENAEKYITGDADNYDKWLCFAKTMPKLIGNPLYHWTHLELKRYFDIDLILNEKNAKEIWDEVNKKLAMTDFSVRNIIKKSNVEVICTTDNPYDSLEYHKKLKEFETKVLPTFRPDIYDIKPDITERMDYFHENGCRLSDHAVDEMTDEVIENLVFLGKEYAKRGWTWQLHIGALRNNNSKMFEKLGPDTGFDSINDFEVARGLSKILGELEKENSLPKTILYCLNPKDNYVLGTMLGNFQGPEAKGKIQFGSGWWFCDNRDGMEEQMRTLANLGCFGNFIGMLTDSRSFVSYTRHEYFRRVLCNLIGKWVEEGEYPYDIEALKEIVTGISYYNAKNYFKF